MSIKHCQDKNITDQNLTIKSYENNQLKVFLLLKAYEQKH